MKGNKYPFSCPYIKHVRLEWHIVYPYILADINKALYMGIATKFNTIHNYIVIGSSMLFSTL